VSETLAAGTWQSLLPPLLAIGLALAFRQVVLALVAGVALGALVASDWALTGAIRRGTQEYAVGTVADPDHATILLFTLLLGGMVGIISRAGGAAGLAAWAVRRATDPRRAQVSTWLLGLLVFVDDYANSLLVGPAMRPVTDRLRISREKLTFLVDATAAPVSSVALVSSWIGVEVGYIADQYARLGLEGDPYGVFLKTLPHRFYPLLMLWLGFLIAWTGRDFGPMRRAEARARTTGQVSGPGARPASDFGGEEADAAPRAGNALLPVAVVVVVTLAGMAATGRARVLEAGEEPTLRAVFGMGDSLRALLWGSLAGCATAGALALATGALRLDAVVDAWMAGLRAMMVGCVILVLAWALGAVCEDVGTATFLIDVVGDRLDPRLLPAAIFLLAAAVSFATGTSWGTMAVFFPLVVPLTHGLAPGQEPVMLGAVGAILAGSVFGDHCSPIADTTVLSSLACSCDHVDHVRTQLPYALVVGATGLVAGELAVGLGLYPAWVGLAIGALALAALVRVLARPAGAQAPAGAAEPAPIRRQPTPEA